VSGLKVLKKSSIVSEHIEKILRSLPDRFRPKVRTIQEAKDLNKLSLENLISSLKSHEIELVGDEQDKKSKSITLTSKGTSAKSLQSIESEEETLARESDNDTDLEEIAYLTKRFQ
jgi:predicted transcriptional regulator